MGKYAAPVFHTATIAITACAQRRPTNATTSPAPTPRPTNHRANRFAAASTCP
ncbi:hypothetical protein LAUMK7_02644 [Mycobacterium kansasii]|nr:hypothetical protein MKSMC1_14760 [Mycobacterium kansasii]VAZ66566.1 hypothetical protein LAUMK40_02702 [Mycobacterium kansasii]VAZ74995.1 hypothetical protein LAUMK7_02644 [Mycobacterium kansasii]